MVAVTGGVGVAAALSLCSILIWPIRLRSCELQTLLSIPNLAMGGSTGAGPMLTKPPLSCRSPWSSTLTFPDGLLLYANELQPCIF